MNDSTINPLSHSKEMATIYSPSSIISLILFQISIFCSFFYFLGSYTNNNILFDQSISSINQHHQLNCTLLQKNNLTSNSHRTIALHFEPHYNTQTISHLQQQSHFLTKICPSNFTNYCPCHDTQREENFIRNKLQLRKERHCPDNSEELQCLVPRPVGYKRPFPWPKSRDQAWFQNVPFKKLTVLKKDQNWVRLKGDRLVFPGGGTSFPMGIKSYIGLLKRIVPLENGAIRTALDTGCGVASFGGWLMEYNILTMSIAPKDIHEAQVQFALERGLPAMIGVLGTYRLPFPSRSFDMAHCSRCLINWTANGGLYLLEIDRILRHGGYWVLSGPPIAWKNYYKGWQRTPKDLENEQKKLENLATRLCWKKVRERGPIAVWQKPTNHIHCDLKLKNSPKSLKFCNAADDPDYAWYMEMDACITRLPPVEHVKDISGGGLMKWPKRLMTALPRMKSNGFNIKTFDEINELWKRRILYYRRSLGYLSRYRNIMDMNAGIGGFAASISEYPVWVMNVVPFDARNNTLGIIYERGLIGTYMNWCEPFSTYPRTYDLIHADGVFSLYIHRCGIENILVEMYRILRPEGSMIIRDHVDIVTKVKGYVEQMKWQTKFLNSEVGPLDSEKVLFVNI